MISIVADGRYGLRILRREWVTSLLAIISIALGIGANIAIFSLTDVLLLRPLSGVRAPDRLVRIGVALPSTVLDDLGKEPVFTGACGVSTPLLTTEFHGEVQPVGILSLSGDCPEVFGISAEFGRMLAVDDDQPGTPNVAVLTDSFWRHDFAGRPEAIGGTIRIDGVPFTIVGVTQPDFQGILLGFAPGVLVAAAHDPSSAHVTQGPRPYSMGNVFARLRRGVSIQQAQARIDISMGRLLVQYAPPEFHGARRQEFLSQTLTLLPGANGLDYTLRGQYGRPLEVSLGICTLVLLLSCTNLANLLLARGVRRRKEIALRLAVGANRASVVRQLTIESLLLVVSGSLAGIAFAYGVNQVLLTEVHKSLVNFSLSTQLDGRVLAFGLLAILFTAVGFGIVPAWRTADVSLIEVLKAATRGVHDRNAATRTLIAVQIAFTLALVTGAGLFVSSLQQLRSVPLGYRVEKLVEAQLFPLPDGYKDFAATEYYSNLLNTVKGLPGVESASLSNFAPLFSVRYAQPVRLADDFSGPGVPAQAYWVTDNFLHTMNIPLVTGRDFGRMDRAAGPHTAIVSRSLARRLWPAGDIIGRHVRFGTVAEDQDLEVVGIAADARLANVRDDPATIYINLWQYSYSAKYGVLVVRDRSVTSGFLLEVERAVRGEGREYVQSIRTLEDRRDHALLPERLVAWLSSAFGILALILASAGLYGLMAYHVASRTGEIGIRIALGATRSRVRRLVLADALRLVSIGCAAGLLLTMAEGRFVGALLFGVRPFDPLYFGIALAVLLSTAGVAAWVPARRASRIDPMAALRHE